MGGGSSSTWKPSRQQIELEAKIGDIQSKINQMNTLKNGLNQQIKTMKYELSQLTNNIKRLESEITTDRNTITRLTIDKESLEENLETAKYLLKSVEQAIDDIKKYGNLQKRTQNFFDGEYETLYEKVILRQRLKQDDYINRNSTLQRAIVNLKNKYSNDYRNTEYQDEHTAYFISLNSIFWWIYYILCLVILYQIVYIQNEMGLKTKVIWVIVLMLYPLAYRIYDLVVTKK
jgi:archaellum component FlaC